jgi:hypothetical protein
MREFHTHNIILCHVYTSPVKQYNIGLNIFFLNQRDKKLMSIAMYILNNKTLYIFLYRYDHIIIYL